MRRNLRYLLPKMGCLKMADPKPRNLVATPMRIYENSNILGVQSPIFRHTQHHMKLDEVG
jgi:hypothetical protein